MELLLKYAQQNAITEYEKLEVEYYQIYLSKLQAVQSGNKDNFDTSNNALVELSQKGFPLAMHIVAKELYKVALNATQGKYKKQKKNMIAQAADLFQQAAAQQTFSSFYYLGDMAENGDLPGGIDLAYAYECYLIGASFDSPQCYFKLAQFYKKGMIIKKDENLYYYYTKKAAEMGVVEAQHNLGLIYLEGKSVKFDAIKALAWFTQAGAQNFQISLFNCAQLYLEGSKDGKIKQNYKAALIYFQKLEKEKQIKVDKYINRCVDALSEMEEQKNKNNQNSQHEQQK
ncbi:hypothetical protein PPERSA_03713 [Pseudocohnilembus persalinus]|uniref:Uncharacterized protein n=1 Tax=Pseudocohnilembus persalinus TaxID=266149 RepID=A0A0V0QHB1_PSEPJ|nr:hypothetical protein PPERSA_03713 [Pseudocohnilembus persalinus]|eukprot:KRX01629.1 hypothetical protein PPERSA_03713 [Pseudocohnilembus persalinus]